MGGLQPGDLLPSGRFRLGAAVSNAQGAFGSVFEGVNDAGTRLAIKNMAMSAAIQNLRAIYPNLPNPRAHMAREWRGSLLDVVHPHLCRTYAVEFTDAAGQRSSLESCDFAYLVMEWAGTALIDVVLQRGGLREEEAREYFRQTLVGIQVLHARGISHRDIKPENVRLHACIATPQPAAPGHCCCTRAFSQRRAGDAARSANRDRARHDQDC